MMNMPYPDAAAAPAFASSGSLVSTSGRVLPLTAVHAHVDAAEGLCRLVLRQRFENAHDVPLEVTYSLPLPAEAAVSGFSFLLGSRRIVGEVDKKRRARERYDEAMATGYTAALVEQDRDTLFTQAIGNVPPRTAIEAEIVIDMKLRFLDEGAWELRLPTTVAPRYLGEAGRVADAGRIAQDVSDGPMPVRLTLEALIRGAGERAVESTTHAIEETRSTHVGANPDKVVRFKDPAGVALDRDVVLRWPATQPQQGSLGVAFGAPPQVSSAVRVTRRAGADAAYALLTLAPPRQPRATVARDLILLLDTSGSMHGLPIEQAKRISTALVSTLGPSDTLEMISFSSSPVRWKGGGFFGGMFSKGTAMTPENRAAAIQWLSGLTASGGTEMHEAILEALKPLRGEAQRQVVLVTDGLIGFETEIVRAILDKLPTGSRVHTVGVGSGINRTLTAGAARAGRGVEVLADSNEDPERVAARLVARTHAPLVTDLTVSGAVVRRMAPQRLPDLFAGAPFVVAAEVDPKGGTIVLEGRGAEGRFRTEVVVPACRESEGLGAIEQLYGRERAADLEMQAAGGENVDAALEVLGLAHGIATRMTSWIAVTEEKTVDETTPFRRERMPHELPYGTAAEAFGLRPVGAVMQKEMERGAVLMPASAMPMPMRPGMGAIGRTSGLAGGGPGSSAGERPTGAPPPPAHAAAPKATPPRSPMIARSRSESVEEKKRKGGFAEKADDQDDFASVPRPSALAPTADFGAAPREEADESEEAASGAKLEQGAGGGIVLVGEVVLVRPGSIVIETTVTDELVWRGFETATIYTQDGQVFEVKVRGPKSGIVAAGSTVRLIVELEGTLATMVAALVAQGGSCTPHLSTLRLDDGLCLMLTTT